MKTYKNFASQMNATPQSKPIPGRSDQVQNNAGGFVFEVDRWTQLGRFLVLGSEGGTYYVKEAALTEQNAKNVLACIKEDGPRVVKTVAEVSEAGRAPRNTPAEFVLALCIKHGDLDTRRAAYNAIPKVCRIGTHLFHLVGFVDKWGRGMRSAVARWYNEMPSDKLAYQVVKYQQRDGWSHRDALILAHPRPVDDPHNDIYKYVVSCEFVQKESRSDASGLAILDGFEQIKKATTAKEAASLVTLFDLPRECVPTQFLNDKDVWVALLEKMPITATIRNLGKMTEVGLLAQGSRGTKIVVDRLVNPDSIKKGRVHPMQYLYAMKTYASGQGFRGSLKWNPVPAIVDALDAGFYASFGAVEPTGKRILLALDISGSMGASMMDTNLSCREASAAMALVTANVETGYQIVGFSAEPGRSFWNRDHNKIIPLDITPRRRLDDIVKYTTSLEFGGTDCALPMIYALENGINADAFVIYTDSETWAGNIHPTQALKTYRQKTGINAKLVVVGMTSSGFSVSDPTDPGSMDVVGFDTNVPNVISDFIRGAPVNAAPAEEEL